MATFVDVITYGAACNGTTDDTRNLNNAIAAGTAQKKPVVIPYGTLLHQPIAINNPVEIIFQRSARLKLKAGSVGHQIVINASDVTLNGGGTVDGSSSGGAGVFIGAGLSNITIRDLNFRSHKESHIQVKGMSGPPTSYVTIDGCSFKDAGGHAVYGNWEAPNAQLTNLRFLGGKQNAIWWGNNSPDLLIRNCGIENYGRIGIEVWQARERATILQNRISKTGEFGISVDSCNAAEVAGNTVVRDPADTRQSFGIELVKLTNSIGHHNRIFGWYLGTNLDQCSNCIQEANVIASPVPDAIGVYVTTQTPIPAKRNHVFGQMISLSGADARGIWAQNNHPAGNMDFLLIDANHLNGPGIGYGNAIRVNNDAGQMTNLSIMGNFLEGWAIPFHKSDNAIPCTWARNELVNCGDLNINLQGVRLD